jgi:hypothetical protein
LPSRPRNMRFCSRRNSFDLASSCSHPSNKYHHQRLIKLTHCRPRKMPANCGRDNIFVQRTAARSHAQNRPRHRSGQVRRPHE